MTTALPLPSGSAAGTSWAPDKRAVNVTVVCFALATLPVARSPMAAISTTNHTRRFASWALPSRVWVTLPRYGRYVPPQLADWRPVSRSADGNREHFDGPRRHRL